MKETMTYPVVGSNCTMYSDWKTARLPRQVAYTISITPAGLDCEFVVRNQFLQHIPNTEHKNLSSALLVGP